MLTIRKSSRFVLILCLAAPASALASAAPDGTPAAAPIASAAATASDPALVPAASVAADAGDDDGVLQATEPDFRVVNLPTPMRLPRGKGNFTLTHRFGGNFRHGSFSSQASNLFGLDEGATIGLEYRYGVARHLEAVVYRTSFSRTWQLSAKYDALRQRPSMPVSLAVMASDEGINNFKNDHAQAVAVTVGRALGEVANVYAVPTLALNSAAAAGIRRNTVYVGVGARLRIRPTVYVSGDVLPRLGGYAPGTRAFGVALEKRVGGHLFQINLSNTAGSTPVQLARGGSPRSLSLGFNLTRKFF